MGKLARCKTSNKMHNYKTRGDKNTKAHINEKEWPGGLLAERCLNLALNILNAGLAF